MTQQLDVEEDDQKQRDDVGPDENNGDKIAGVIIVREIVEWASCEESLCKVKEADGSFSS